MDRSEGGGKLHVRCKIKHLSFSAHADAKGIMTLIKQIEPANVMLVHGEKKKMQFCECDLVLSKQDAFDQTDRIFECDICAWEGEKEGIYLSVQPYCFAVRHLLISDRTFDACAWRGNEITMCLMSS